MTLILPKPKVVERFVKTLQESLAENRNTIVEREEDVAYEEGGQRVDFWGPTKDANFIAIHGGYWQEGDRKYFTTIVKPLVDEGVTVAVVGYDLASQKPLREIINQVKKAVTFIMEYCPNATFAIGGHSAGGHLSALVASELPKIDRLTTLILMCGVFKLGEIVDTYIGRGIHLTPDMAKECSLDEAKLIEKFGEKSIVLLNSEFDAVKLKQQNAELEDLLRSLGAKDLRSVEISNTDHFSIIEHLREKGHPATQALLQALLP
ncbi:hypothetical protein L596_028252 [Steinernema carpocapsae]|uniref:BD-FAE-like domain-containing protein n=1 Tax=Steinernema carpocapsae TaxID=34508 RepID=A0A4U5LXZ1_STECR|nr:hypothetical protein L596_028252 [Steinernema carpocapsae]